MTGADLYALCSDAISKSITRQINNIDRLVSEWNSNGPHGLHPHPTSSVYYLDHFGDGFEVVVEQRDFEDAVFGVRASVGDGELERYRRIREQFEPKIEDGDKKDKEKDKGKKDKGKGKDKMK